MSALMNGPLKATRSNWNVRLNLRGYRPTTVFERSPVLGTTNVRVRPVNTREWLHDYLGQRPEVVSDFLAANGLEVADDERAEVVEALLPDLFAAVCGKLDGAAGYRPGDPAPSLERGLSFRVPAAEQCNVAHKAGAGPATGPTDAPASRDELVARIAAQRARIAAARNAPTAPAADLTPDAGDGKKPRKAGK
jgi:hypothetical protein